MANGGNGGLPELRVKLDGAPSARCATSWRGLSGVAATTALPRLEITSSWAPPASQ